MKSVHSTSVRTLIAGVALLAASNWPSSANCVLDTSFNPGGSFASGAAVYAVAVQSDGKVIFGGSFTYNGTYQNGYPFTTYNLVRFNANGTVDTSYTPSPDYPVLTMVIQSDDKLIIGGQFTYVGGYSQTYICRVHTSGSPDYNGFQAPTPNNYPYALGLLSDGKVVVGGAFTNLSGASYARVACLNTNGSLVTNFNPGVAGSANAAVYAIAVYSTNGPSGDKIVIGGDFSSVGGAGHINLARLNSGGSVDSSFSAVFSGYTPNYLNGPVYALATDYAAFGQSCSGGGSCEKVYIGGAFTSPRNYFTRLANGGTLDSNIESATTDWVVEAIRIQSSHAVVIGGGFTNAVGTLRNRVARFFPGTEGGGINDLLNLTSWSDCDPNGATGGTVKAIGLNSSDAVYIGGTFSNFEASSRPKIARLVATP